MTTTFNYAIEDFSQLSLKEITVKEAFEAIKKNGLEWVRGDWFSKAYDSEDGQVKPTGACVLGQAAINLGVSTDEDDARLSDFINQSVYTPDDDVDLDEVDEFVQSLGVYSLLRQLNKFKVDKNAKWNTSEALGRYQSNLGDAIIYWNDAKEADSLHEYVIKTYAEVVAIAKELMEPFFDEKIKILAIDREVSWV